jgi:hypothetical protein
MKRNSSLWLQEVGTREGNQMVYRRAYIPSHLTDIRETFNKEQNRLDEEWLKLWLHQIERND